MATLPTAQGSAGAQYADAAQEMRLLREQVSRMQVPAVEHCILRVGDRVRVVRKVLSQDAVRMSNLASSLGSAITPVIQEHGPSRVIAYPHPWLGCLVGSWQYGMDRTIGLYGEVVSLATSHRQVSSLPRPDTDVHVSVEMPDGSTRLWWYSRLAVEKVNEVQQPVSNESENEVSNNEINNAAPSEVPELTPGLAQPSAARPVFQVGQRVRIARKVYSVEQTSPDCLWYRVPQEEAESCIVDPLWRAVWNGAAMSPLVGRVGTVVRDGGRHGLRVSLPGYLEGFSYSPLSLELVEDLDQPEEPTVPELRPGLATATTPTPPSLPSPPALVPGLAPQSGLAAPELRPGLAAAEAETLQEAAAVAEEVSSEFQEGDLVRVMRSVYSSWQADAPEDATTCDQTEASWVSPEMDETIGLVGRVLLVDSDGDVEVMFSDFVSTDRASYYYSPLALELVAREALQNGIRRVEAVRDSDRFPFQEGDRVRVARVVQGSDERALEGSIVDGAWRNGWAPIMSRTLGMVGVIEDLGSSTGVAVNLGEVIGAYRYSPLSLDLFSRAEEAETGEAETGVTSLAESGPARAVSEGLPEEIAFEVGDRVRVVRRVLERGATGRRNTGDYIIDPRSMCGWVVSMDGTIGREGTISLVGNSAADSRRFSSQGHRWVNVAFDGGDSWNYSPLALELVSQARTQATPEQEPVQEAGATSRPEFQVGDVVRVVRAVYSAYQRLSSHIPAGAEGTVMQTSPTTGVSIVTASGGLYNVPPLSLELVRRNGQPVASPAPELRPIQPATPAATLAPAPAPLQPAWPTRLYMVLGGACGSWHPSYVLGVIPAYAIGVHRLGLACWQETLVGSYREGSSGFSPFLKTLLQRELGGDWVSTRISGCSWAEVSRSSAALRAVASFLLYKSEVESEDDPEDEDAFAWLSVVEMDMGTDYAILNCTSIEGFNELVYRN